MITFLSILFFVGMLIFIVGLGWLIFSLIKKSKNFKVPAILMTIGAVCAISTFFIPFNDTNTSSTSQDSSTVSNEEDYEVSRADLNCRFMADLNCRFMAV